MMCVAVDCICISHRILSILYMTCHTNAKVGSMHSAMLLYIVGAVSLKSCPFFYPQSLVVTVSAAFDVALKVTPSTVRHTCWSFYDLISICPPCSGDLSETDFIFMSSMVGICC